MKNILSNSLKTLTASAIGVIAITLASTPADAIVPSTPALWGVDEDDGQLFTIGDYTDVNNTFMDFGQLKWNDNGILRKIGSDIESFTLDKDGTAYLGLDRGLGEFADLPNVNTLLSFNIKDAVQDNTVVNVLGIIGAAPNNEGINYDHKDDNISGLSIDPETGNLVALLKNFTTATDENGNVVMDKNGKPKKQVLADELYVISKEDGSLVEEIGAIKFADSDGTRPKFRSGSGEDIEFDHQGNLYVTDNEDDQLYQVDPDTGEIIAVIDTNQKEGFQDENGSPAGSVKIEALAWDFMNNKLIVNDDDNDAYGEQTLQQGGNVYFGSIEGLTDVEGIDFVPTVDGEVVPKSVPEPASTLGFLTIAALGAGSLRKRQQRS